MRLIAALILTPLLSQARVCGPETEATVEVTAPAPIASAAVPIASKHGGTIVTVDDVQLELIVKGDGEVVAYPVAATANATPTLRAEANVTVAVPVESGGVRPVQLVYVPGSARFEGRVTGARVVTRPADVEVTVVDRGRRRHARAQRVVFAPVAVVEARPATVRVQPATVVVQQPAVVVQQPVLRVNAPTVDVRIGAPAVRVVVDDGPRGRHDNGLHLGHRDRGRDDDDDRGRGRGGRGDGRGGGRGDGRGGGRDRD